jgi:hypothetical protein
MEAEDRSGLSAREGARTRRGCLRGVRHQYGFFTTGHAAAGFCGQTKISEGVGIDGAEQEIVVGRGSYRAGGRGRWTVRPREYAHALSEMPQGRYCGLTVATEKSYFLKRRSLSEKPVEGIARIHGVFRSRSVDAGNRLAACVLSGDFTRHGDARRKQRTFVGLILNRDSHRYGLHALEPGGRLEVHALFTTMQRDSALRAIAREIRAGRQGRGATVTARRGHRLDKARQPGPCDIQGRTRARGLGTLSVTIAVSVTVTVKIATGIVVAVLSVFTIGVHEGSKLLV